MTHGCTFERVHSFAYLEPSLIIKITTNEIKKSIMAENSACFANLIRPVVTYGAESWTMTTVELYKHEDIVHFVKARRIGWLGHVHRMPPDRPPHRLLNDSSEMGKRRRRRPRTRWMQDVKMDLRHLDTGRRRQTEWNGENCEGIQRLSIAVELR